MESERGKPVNSLMITMAQRSKVLKEAGLKKVQNKAEGKIKWKKLCGQL